MERSSDSGIGGVSGLYVAAGIGKATSSYKRRLIYMAVFESITAYQI